MALSSNNNISKLKLGRLSQHTMGLLRLIHKLLGVKFKIEEIEKDDYEEEYNEEDEDMNEHIDDNFEDEDKESVERIPMPK